MRKLYLYLPVLLLLAVFFMGCAMATAPVTGTIYNNSGGPVTATSNEGWTKVGFAEATSILGVIGSGDATIQEACKNGGIKKIHHVDYKCMSILGLYAKYTCYVYGD